MGNKGSGLTPEGYSSTAHENSYETSLPSRYPPAFPPTPSSTSSAFTSSPPLPPRAGGGIGFERRTMSVVTRDRSAETARTVPALRRLSASEAVSGGGPVDTSVTDDLGSHLVENRPKDNQVDVPLGTTITVFFDKDVKTVNINKLFEVQCDSVDPTLNPVKGRISYDARQLRAEFTPHNTLFPNSEYTVTLMGRAVTTAQCSHSANIKNTEIHFQTCNPAPKSIGIKLKGQLEEPEKIQIASYYDLYNSLIVWSTRKWGCSGEHVTGMYTENEDGKLVPLRADHDVLNLKENEVVVVEIKD